MFRPLNNSICTFIIMPDKILLVVQNFNTALKKAAGLYAFRGALISGKVEPKGKIQSD